MSEQKAYFGNKSQLRNRPFLVIKTAATPNNKAVTSVAGWGNNGSAWNVSEDAKIVDRVSYKMLHEATLVIDILNSEVVKNQHSAKFTNERMLEHFMPKYSDLITKGIAEWAKTNKPVPSVTETPKEGD